MPLTKIDTGAIKDDAINSAKIADGTVVAADVVDNTITGAKLASDIAISTTGTVTATSFSGDGASLTALNVSTDTSPQLGGNLDLNSNNITGTGNSDKVGTITTDGLTVAGNVSIDGGTIKLDGNYPVGTNNVALGNTALDGTSGGNNVALGAIALTANTTGGSNTAIGSLSLCANTTGDCNTALGRS